MKIIATILCILLLAVNVYGANVMPTDSYSFQIISIVNADTDAPYVTDKFPQPGAVNVPINTIISCHVKDDMAGVDELSIEMRVNGAIIVPNITGDKYDFTVTHDPVTLPYGQVVNVTIDAVDLANN